MLAKKKANGFEVFKDSLCLLLRLSTMVKSLTTAAVPINRSGSEKTVGHLKLDACL